MRLDADVSIGVNAPNAWRSPSPSRRIGLDRRQGKLMKGCKSLYLVPERSLIDFWKALVGQGGVHLFIGRHEVITFGLGGADGP